MEWRMLMAQYNYSDLIESRSVVLILCQQATTSGIVTMEIISTDVWLAAAGWHQELTTASGRGCSRKSTLITYCLDSSGSSLQIWKAGYDKAYNS